MIIPFISTETIIQEFMEMAAFPPTREFRLKGILDDMYFLPQIGNINVLGLDLRESKMVCGEAKPSSDLIESSRAFLRRTNGTIVQASYYGESPIHGRIDDRHRFEVNRSSGFAVISSRKNKNLFLRDERQYDDFDAMYIVGVYKPEKDENGYREFPEAFASVAKDYMAYHLKKEDAIKGIANINRLELRNMKDEVYKDMAMAVSNIIFPAMMELDTMIADLFLKKVDQPNPLLW